MKCRIGVDFMDKNIPIKIQFNYHARGFYCPKCFTGGISRYKRVWILWAKVIISI